MAQDAVNAAGGFCEGRVLHRSRSCKVSVCKRSREGDTVVVKQYKAEALTDLVKARLRGPPAQSRLEPR